MTNESHESVRRWLSQAATYPEGGPVEVRETHISVVFLTPTHAYKLLKPVKFDFLDFSTREAREAECRNEVCLNRRLAADVYLDVIPVTHGAKGLALDGDGTPLDCVIRMRRLPDDATLEARIRAGTATSSDLERVLDVLLPFLQRAETGPSINDGGDTAVIRRNLVENLVVLDRQPTLQEPAATLRSMQLQFLATRDSLFRRRIADGWIRDGHGDLRAEHVYLTDPPVIVDCIAFNDRFRHVDLLDEICFLATDLRRLGRDDLAVGLIDRYRERMNDPAPVALAAFFQSYRFAVRAKVACLRDESRGTAVRNDKSAKEAAELLTSATDVLRPFHQPCLIVFCGISGSGKSTIARRLAAEIGAVHVASDVVRKELYGVETDDHSSPADMYSDIATAKTYAVMRERAADSLNRGATVLLDATFQRESNRTAVRDLAREGGVPFFLAYCRCEPETAKRRIRDRQQHGRDASDADVAVLRRQLQGFEPPLEVGANELVELSSDDTADENCRRILDRLPLVEA